MTAKTIEELATNAVKKSILTTDFLDQYISENDKEPSWDGNVYIYRDNKKKKKDLRGRVPVQIKGKKQDTMPSDGIYFPVNIVDMNNFLYDGGVFYFVVYVTSDGKKESIYYNTLTPVKLKNYLNNVGNQKSKTVKFYPFPQENNRKATIFLNFFLDCKKQVSFASHEILSIHDIKNMDGLTGITFSVTGYGYKQNDLHKALSENEVYVYANIKGSNVPIPTNLEPSSFHMQRTEECKVSINKRIYYTILSYNLYKQKVFIKIGKSLTFGLVSIT